MCETQHPTRMLLTLDSMCAHIPSVAELIFWDILDHSIMFCGTVSIFMNTVLIFVTC